MKLFYGKILANQVNKVAFTNFQRLCSFWRKVHPLQIKAACRPPPPKYDACQIFQLEYRPLNSPASHCTCDKWSHHLLNFNDFNFLLSALISVLTKISILGAQPIVIKLGSSDWFWRLTNNQQRSSIDDFDVLPSFSYPWQKKMKILKDKAASKGNIVKASLS